MSKWGAIYFAIVGLLAAISLFVPGAVLVGLFLLIVPGLILIIAPPLFIYSLIAWCIWTAAGRWHWTIRAGAVVAAWTAFAVLPPLLYNAPGKRLRAELVSADLSFSGAPVKGGTVAILTPDRKFNLQKDAVACDAICLRLLYNGAAQRVIREDWVPSDLAVPLRSFRIERRDTCPPRAQIDDASMPGERAVFTDRPADRIRARIAAGECLIEEATGLSQADAVLTEWNLRSRKGSSYASPWDLKLDTVAARRIEVGLRGGASMTVRLRKTEVASELLFIPFIVGPISGSGMSMTVGFFRWPITENRFTMEEVAAGVFGDGLKMPERPSSGPNEIQTLIAALRNPDLPADSPQLKLADQVLKQIAFQKSAGPDDFEAVRLMIDDRRITDFFNLAGAVAKLGPEAAGLAGPLLDRLMAAPLPQGRDIVQTTSRAIYRLPAGALLPVQDKLETLTQTPTRRGTAYLASSRLSDEGAAAVPKLLALMDARNSFDKLLSYDDERDVLTGALIGLCRLGTNAVAAHEPLAAFIREQPLHDPRRRLAVEALVRSGGKDLALDAARGQAERMKVVEREIQQAENPRNLNICQY